MDKLIDVCNQFTENQTTVMTVTVYMPLNRTSIDYKSEMLLISDTNVCTP